MNSNNYEYIYPSNTKNIIINKGQAVKVIKGVEPKSTNKELELLSNQFNSLKNDTEKGMEKLSLKQQHDQGFYLNTNVNSLKTQVNEHLNHEYKQRKEQMNTLSESINDLNTQFINGKERNNNLLNKEINKFNIQTEEINKKLDTGINSLNSKLSFYNACLFNIVKHFNLLPLDPRANFDNKSSIKYQRKPEYTIREILQYENKIKKYESQDQLEEERKLEAHLLKYTEKLKYKNLISNVNTIEDRLQKTNKALDPRYNKKIKLKSFFNVIVAINKLKIFRHIMKFRLKMDTLDYFVTNFFQLEKTLINTIEDNILIILDKFEFDLLFIDEHFLNVNYLQNEQKWINIKQCLILLFENFTKLVDDKGFILAQLNKDEIVLLKLLISEDCFIPFDFYTIFELTRLEHNNGGIVNLTNNHKIMILLVYFIIKVLILRILSRESRMKTIATILFHETLQLCRILCDRRYIGTKKHLIDRINNQTVYLIPEYERNMKWTNNVSIDEYYNDTCLAYINRVQLLYSMDQEIQNDYVKLAKSKLFDQEVFFYKENINSYQVKGLMDYDTTDDNIDFFIINNIVFDKKFIRQYDQMKREEVFDLKQIIFNFGSKMLFYLNTKY